MNTAVMDILHVEDDYADAVLIQDMLNDQTMAKSTFNIVRVESLKQALNEINNNQYSAVLLDLGLQDVIGLDNVRAIKDENPDLPIVVLTGSDCERQALEAVRSGAQEYIVKGRGDGSVIRLAIKSSVERKQYERKLFHQANFDDLTGLPNRRHFMLHLKGVLERAERWDRKESVMFMDLNKFKDINDTLGHEVGNQVIKEFAMRMKEALRSTDVLARYGGDEFVLHLDDRPENIETSCKNVTRKIFAALAPPFFVDGHVLEVSASIGIAIFPNNGQSVDELLEKADAAMYLAKKKGPNSYVFATYQYA